MTSSKKGNQWDFGMKAHIGVDTVHGLVHTLEVTTGKVSDYSMAETSPVWGSHGLPALWVTRHAVRASLSYIGAPRACLLISPRPAAKAGSRG